VPSWSLDVTPGLPFSPLSPLVAGPIRVFLPGGLRPLVASKLLSGSLITTGLGHRSRFLTTGRVRLRAGGVVAVVPSGACVVAAVPVAVFSAVADCGGLVLHADVMTVPREIGRRSRGGGTARAASGTGQVDVLPPG